MIVSLFLISYMKLTRAQGASMLIDSYHVNICNYGSASSYLDVLRKTNYRT